MSRWSTLQLIGLAKGDEQNARDRVEGEGSLRWPQMNLDGVCHDLDISWSALTVSLTFPIQASALSSGDVPTSSLCPRRRLIGSKHVAGVS